MGCTDSEDKFFVDGDSGELRISGIRGRGERALRRSGGVVDFDLWLRGLAEIDQAIGAYGEVGRAQVRAIVLEGEARLAAGRKFVNEAGGGIGDVNDGLAVAGHSHGLVELAGTVAVGAPGVDVLERRRRLRSGSGLCGARATGNERCEK